MWYEVYVTRKGGMLSGSVGHSPAGCPSRADGCPASRADGCPASCAGGRPASRAGASRKLGVASIILKMKWGVRGGAGYSVELKS